MPFLLLLLLLRFLSLFTRRESTNRLLCDLCVCVFRFDDGDLRENIPRSHVTITLPSVVQVHQEKRPWRNLWSPAQQQATPAATSTVYTSSGAGGPSGEGQIRFLGRGAGGGSR